jgi:hypothetical protein
MLSEKEQQQDAPITRAKSGRTTKTQPKCKDYYPRAQELFNDASKEVNDART